MRRWIDLLLLSLLTCFQTHKMCYFSRLQEFGWDLLKIQDLINLDKHLLEIASNLGKPIRHRNSNELIQKLTPISTCQAHSNSLSALYSLGSFPIHVDTAHWPTPCRYVILGCSNEGRGSRRTTLLDFSSISISKYEKEFLLNTPFKIINGRNSFYSSILSDQRNFIRFDRGCMKPITDKDNEAFEILSESRWQSKIIEIEWQAGNILILDNWRVLHGRGCAFKNDFDRCLHRILVV